MSLMKCPECGHEISDKATMCPHCGYKLPTVQESAAPQQSAAPQEVPTAASIPAAQPNSVMDAWKAACPKQAKRRTIIDNIMAFIFLGVMVPLILLFLHAIGVIKPIDDKTLERLNPLELLSYFSECRNFINNTYTAMIVLLCVWAVCWFAWCFGEVMLIAAWLKKGTFDIANYFKKENVQIGGKESLGNWAAYCALSPMGKAMRALLCFGANGMGCGFFISLGIFLHSKAINDLEHAIMGSGSTPFPWEPLVAAVAILVVAIICIVIATSSCKNFLKNYAGQNMQNK